MEAGGRGRGRWDVGVGGGRYNRDKCRIFVRGETGMGVVRTC